MVTKLLLVCLSIPIFNLSKYRTYYYGHQMEPNKMGGACSTHGEMNVYKAVVEKPEGRDL